MNEYCYHGVQTGSNLFGGYTPRQEPCYQLLFALVELAVYNALGIEVDPDGNQKKLKNVKFKATAIAYIKSENFEIDCDALEFPDGFVEGTRKKVMNETHQESLISAVDNLVEVRDAVRV